MNRNQITMAAIGGVALVATLGVGFLAFTSLGETGERGAELESRRNRVSSLKNDPRVAPTRASVEKIDSNRSVVAAWRDKAFEIASQGDASPDAGVTPAAFKQKMVDEARELAALPGAVEGRITKADQDFGFKDYVSGGAMPSPQDLPALQRQWSEISGFVRTLAESGAAEFVGVSVIAQEKEPPPPRGAQQRQARGKRREAERQVAAVQRYRLEFAASPAAFVRTLNALAVSPRFTAVESFDFTRPDTVAELLGGDKSGGKRAPTYAAAATRGRGRIRGALAPLDEEKAPAEAEVARRGLVTDPASATLRVGMTLATYDFGTASAKAEEAAKAAEAEKNSKEGAQ